MCLIALAWRVCADVPLLLLANRDEFRDRPWAPATRWGDLPMLAGRDLRAGGTWLGLADDGRFAALTNVRQPGVSPDLRSRGVWVQRALAAPDVTSLEAQLRQESAHYGGFNLLFGGADALYCWHSPSARMQKLAPGVHALSNADLNDPWPKVVAARTKLEALLGRGEVHADASCWEVLGSAAIPEGDLPDTGVGPDWERRLAPALITGQGYGTLSRNLLRWHADGRIDFHERTVDADGQFLDEHFSKAKA